MSSFVLLKRLSKKKLYTKKRQNRRLHLGGNPQRKAICRRAYWTSPKKPNSARRRVARVLLIATKTPVTAYIPGETHNLQPFSMVLIRGGRVQDIPGVNYKVVRGVLDASALPKRKNGRSKYGTKWWDNPRYKNKRVVTTVIKNVKK